MCAQNFWKEEVRIMQKAFPAEEEYQFSFTRPLQPLVGSCLYDVLMNIKFDKKKLSVGPLKSKPYYLLT